MAQDANSPEAEAVMAILEAGSSAPVSFSSGFSEAVSVDEVNRVIAEVATTMGTPESITPKADRFEVRSATHKIDVRISINDEGLVDGLFFSPLVETGMSVSDAAGTLLGLEGEKSLLVLRNGEPVATGNEDQALAIGSAFKLAIVSVLADQIEAGTHGWDEVVRLSADQKSLPSGRLQNFPDGAPLTLHTAAGLMISESDNTATDLLMDVVGRDAVSDALGQLALNTRELFQLKADADAQAEFLNADDEGKQAVLDRLADAPLPPVSATSSLHVQGIEWYLSVRQLCDLIGPIAQLDVFEINPGIASAEDWARVAFKGGSEPGVINLTSWLEDESGTEFCVSFTLNKDTAITEQDVFGAYAVLLNSLKEGEGA